MAQTYWPMPSGSAGAQVLEPQWSLMARNWLATGVISGFLNQLAVTASGTAMQVNIDTGAANIMGNWFKNDASVVMPIAASDPTNPRIDVIAIRVDWVANTVALVVLQGTPGANPVAPALTQTDLLITPATARWEIALANVEVLAAATTITAADVTDKRTFTGIGTAGLNIPTALKILYSGDKAGLTIGRYNNESDYQIRYNDDGENNQQDNTQSAWALQIGGVADQLKIWRAAPGAAYAAPFFTLDNAGDLTLTGGISALGISPPDTAWFEPTLLNGWTNYGQGYAVAAYRKDSDGFVHLNGLIKGGTITAGTPLFTLPAAYAPATTLNPCTATQGPSTVNACNLNINTNGSVVLQSNGQNTWLELGGVSFYVG